MEGRRREREIEEEKRKNKRTGLDEERKQLPSGRRNDELSFTLISSVKAI